MVRGTEWEGVVLPREATEKDRREMATVQRKIDDLLDRADVECEDYIPKKRRPHGRS